jgi:predicted nuclease with TOPRIM domain
MCWQLAMDFPDKEWQRKGATLSDKTARQEFGLTQDEIYDAIDAGTLQYRQAYMHGNPWLRLLRREVEALARSRHGDDHVDHKQARAELTRVNREIKRLRTELASLEEQRDKLTSALGEDG